MWVLAAAVGLLLALCAPAPAPAACVSELPGRFAALQAALPGALVGVSVVDAESGQAVFQSALAGQRFVPASNNKLLTAWTATQKLGWEFAFETAVYWDGGGGGAPLCVQGRGDPTLTGGQLASAVARALAAAPPRAAVDVVVDAASWFGAATPAVPASWQLGDLLDVDGAMPAATVLDHNTLNLTVTPGARVGDPAAVALAGRPAALYAGSVALDANVSTSAASLPASVSFALGIDEANMLVVRGSVPRAAPPAAYVVPAVDPARYFLAVARNAAALAGAAVRSAALGACSRDAAPAVRIASPPIDAVMNFTLQNSDNLYAELFLRAVGVAAQGAWAPDGDAQAAGLAAVRGLLVDSLQLDPAGFAQFDGSGMSRMDLVQPAFLTALLAAVYAHPDYRTFRGLLPVAGESGTLADRFLGTPAAGRVFAKTGTLSGNGLLSGYALNSNFSSGTLAFSVMVNNALLSADDIRSAIDAFVVDLVLVSPHC